MALIDCPECHKRISESASGCPHCGYMLTPEAVAAVKQNEVKRRELEAEAAVQSKRNDLFAAFVWTGTGIIAVVVGLAVMDAAPSHKYTPHWTDNVSPSETTTVTSSPWLRGFSDREKETILQESYLFDAAAKQLEKDRGY